MLKAAMEEGIYFNLKNEDYHNDPALSHSGMTQLLKSWPDYWERSCHNSDKSAYEPSAAMRLGSYSDQYLLNRDTFYATYNTPDNYNQAVRGKYAIDYGTMKKVKEASACITDVPIGREHFTQGYPQVAIFWRDYDTGVMLRCQIDYLRTFGCIDLKRIKGIDNYEIGRAVRNQGLDIQQYVYLQGVIAARRMLSAGTDQQLVDYAEQEGVDLDWLMAFRDDTDLLFRFLFQRSTPPYVWRFKELDPDVAIEGANAMRKALQIYKESIAKWGLTKPPMGDATITTISPFHVPRREYDYAD